MSMINHPLGPVDVPAQPLASNGLGPLQQYTTFRYHAGGVPSFVLLETRANRPFPQAPLLTDDVRFRIGLRGANGNQATTTLIWARGDRGSRKYWPNTIAGQYALNVRLDLSASSGYLKTIGSFKWKASLRLART